MTLGQYLFDYRTARNLSQRQFALQCAVSNGYIAMLEKGFNPKTGKPIIPTLVQLKKLATGMSMSVSDLIATVDDMPIMLSDASAIALDSFSDLSIGEQSLLTSFRELNLEGQQKVLEYVADLCASGRYIKTASDHSVPKQA